MTRLYGRGFNGGRVYDCVPHGHWSATTMIAAVGTEGTRAPFVFEGAMDAEMFVAYVKHVLVPELKPGDIVVTDFFALFCPACSIFIFSNVEL
jgi:hypothetical protein